MDLLQLQAPFKSEDIEWRIQQSGKSGDKVWALALAYITSRAIQSRLDEVCGVDGWCNKYAPGPDGGVLCGISILTESGSWLTKWDGAANTNIEPVKGGLSGAMKRAGAQFGIGRYLYKLPATFAECDTNPRKFENRAETKDGTKFSWKNPKLPAWATYNGDGNQPDPKTEPIPWTSKDQVKFIKMCQEAGMDENNISGFELYLIDRAKMPHMTGTMARTVFNNFKTIYLPDFNEWVKE